MGLCSSYRGTFIAALLTTAAYGIIPAQLIAQNVPNGAPAGDQDASDSPDGLADIVVTAQRRSERLQDVPISVTAVDAKIVNATGVTSAADLSLVAPAVSFQTNVNGGGVTIRGIGGSFGTGDEPPNAIYVDGVYQASAPAFLSSFNNIERVEVLKGPQGTLFGRNASGGVVQVITKKPSFDTHIDAWIGYGNYQTIDGGLYATTGLTQNLAIDIAATSQKMGDGFGTNRATGKDVYKGYSGSIRGKAYWEIGSNSAATLIGLYSKVKPWEAQGGQIWPGYVDRSGSTGAGFHNVNRNDVTGFTVDQRQVSLTLSHDAPWASLTSITSYDRTRQESIFDQDATPLNILAFESTITSKTLTEELRVQSLPGSKISWIGGVFLYDNKIEVNPILIRGAGAAAFGGSYRYITDSSIQSFAGFGQVTVPLGNTSITAGLRYTLDDKDIGISLLNAAGLPIRLAFSANPRSANATFGKFTYRLAIDHKITRDFLVYASYSTGFKAGAFGLVSLSPSGTTATSTFPPPVSPQTVTAYEGGFKAEFLNRALRFNASAFCNRPA